MKYFFLICLCPFLCWGQWETTREDEALFLNRIADFWEEGEYQIAKNQIHEFLALYPNSPFSDSLCSAIGDLFLREKNHAQALDYYAKVTNPQVVLRIFPHRIQCLYALQWYAVLADECEAHLQTTTAPNSEVLQITYYLATALYHQCLNAVGDPENLLRLATRATPYFETLFASSLKAEIASPYAHLLCVTKDFPKAASIYLELANNGSEDMLFQAALIQAEYDKELSLKTFDTLQNLKPESSYNRLVLLFDLKKYEDIVCEKDTILDAIPREKIPMAHLFLGRSLFALQKYQEASLELESYIDSQTTPSDTLHSALVALLEASIQIKDCEAITQNIAKIETFYPHDESILKGKFSRALINREKNNLQEAKEELENLVFDCKNPRPDLPDKQSAECDSNLPQVVERELKACRDKDGSNMTADFCNQTLAQKPEILLELIHVCNQMNHWEEARTHSLSYLSQFQEETSLVKKYLIYASTELANRSVEGKRQLAHDLKSINESPLLLAKTLFSLHEYQEALPILLEIPEDDGNIYLLCALCYRDGFQDLHNFCVFGEKALSASNRSLDEGALHSALYNAYLTLSHTDEALVSKSAVHLFQAFNLKTPITTEHLLWLSERFIADGNIPHATSVLEHIVQLSKSEIAMLELGKIYRQSNRLEDAIPLLQSLNTTESSLLLGEIYVACGKKEEAQEIFAKICQESSSLKTYFGASACLQNARLQSENGNVEQVLNQYKNLVLQKNIVNEPFYLEAALDYVSLQTKLHGDDQTKKIALLKKLKKDFENTEDLLSKDYHAARSQYAKQDAIYQSYMNFFEAEMLHSQSLLEDTEQNELQAKAKDLLLKIVEEKAHPAIVDRANQCLKQ